MQPTLLILAAGVGSRYGGLKQIDSMGPAGESILDYSVYDARQAGFGKVVFVIRKDIEKDFRAIVGRRIEQQLDTAYAYQELNTALDWLPAPPVREKPWGTGHAVLAARSHLQAPFVVINADDFYGRPAFQQIAHFCTYHCQPDEYGMVAYNLGNTLSENGTVSRGICSVNTDGFLTQVVEQPKIKRHKNGIYYTDEAARLHRLAAHTPVSMNFWALHQTVLPEIERMFRQFVVEHGQNPRAEFYIPKVINQLIEEQKIRLRVLNSKSQWYGVTYTADKETVRQALERLTRAGDYPSPLWS